MAKIFAIASTSFHETLRRKVLYFLLAAMLLVMAAICAELGFLHMATEAGEADTVNQLHSRFVQTAAGVWSFATLFLALFLGAVAVSSEVARKTLANVLARPVSRPAYLFGRWLGVLAFLWLFQVIGLLVTLLIGYLFHIGWNSMGWIAMAEAFCSSFFYSAVSLGLGSVMPSVLAGICAFLLPLLPNLTEDFAHHPFWLLRGLADFCYYLAPAQMPVDTLSVTLSKQLLHPAFGLYLQVLSENVLYAAVVMVLTGAVFARRELRLR